MSAVAIFDKQGKYVRTVFPQPGFKTPQEKPTSQKDAVIRWNKTTFAGFDNESPVGDTDP